MDHRRSNSNPKFEAPSNISNVSVDSISTLVSSPPSPLHYRANYQPIASLPEEEDISYRGAEQLPQNENAGQTFAQRSQAFGLGLGINVNPNRKSSLARVPVGSKGSPATPGAYDPLSSPPTDREEQQHIGGMGFPDDDDLPSGHHQPIPSVYQSFTPSSEHEALHKNSMSATIQQMDSPGSSHPHNVHVFSLPIARNGPIWSVLLGALLHMNFDVFLLRIASHCLDTSLSSECHQNFTGRMRLTSAFHPSGRDFECRSKRNIHHARGSWLSVIILILAVYSTVFSGIWLALAIIRPRYGQRISNDSNLPPSTASLLCAAFAKSIELSFTTVFVAFLGQVLTRRAFSKRSKGVTIADMSMRSWIMQPGVLLTHWQNVGQAAFTILGLIALSAAVMATFYTTASDALGESQDFGFVSHLGRIFGAAWPPYGSTFVSSN